MLQQTKKGIKVPLGFSSSQLQTSTFLGHTDAVPEPVEGRTARLACPRRVCRSIMIPMVELTVVITDMKSIKEQSHLSLFYLLLIFFSFSDISHMMLLYVEAKLSFTSLILSVSSAYLYAALIAPRGFKQLK